jgi:hypothetical protein
MSYGRLSILIALVLAFTPAACGERQSQPSRAVQGDSLTQRQRDSMLAESGIPGARGVGRARRVADSVSARVQATDSVDITP